MSAIVYNLEAMYRWRHGKFAVFSRANRKGKSVVSTPDSRVSFENWDPSSDKIFSFAGEEHTKLVNAATSGDFSSKYSSAVSFKLNNPLFPSFSSLV